MKNIQIQLSQEKVNNFLIKMIENNKIEGLVPLKITRNILYADVDGLISLSEKYKSNISYNQIKETFKKIAKRLETLNQYMIYDENILMTKEYIYLDEKENIYLIPNINSVYQKDIKNLFNEIMNTFNIQIDEDASKIIELNNYFNTLNYSIKGMTDKFNSEKYNEVEKSGNIQINKEKLKSKNPTNKMISKKEKPSFNERIFGYFKKKPYTIKSLDIDFKLPKNNQKKYLTIGDNCCNI